MKYLFIDTETTGLPKDESLSPIVIDNWPRLVSFAYILCDERKIVDKDYFIIKPNKFIIPTESTKIHGITTAEAISKGVALSDVLDFIRPLIENCDYIVGHNVDFDINVLNAEFYRYNMTLPVSLKPYYCTMLLSKDYCGLLNNKYPTLEELYSILKGQSISNAHNAMTDTQASMKCFWILNDIGIVGSMSKKPTVKLYPTADNISWAAEHVSLDYSAKAYAYLTIVCNLLYNKSNFLKSKDDYDSFSDMYLDSLFKFDDSVLKRLDEKTRKEFEYYSKDCTCTKNPHGNCEWVNNMFNFLKEEIQKTVAMVRINKYDRSRIIINRSYLRYHLKELEKEIGGKELIDKYKLKYPETPSPHLILEDETCWVDIVTETVKTRIQPTEGIGSELLSQVDAEKYFISMIEYFNNIRSTERDKKLDEWHRGFEKSLDPKTLKESEEIIKNYSSPHTSSSSGCMLLLSLFVGIGSFLCFIIFVLLNHQ